MGLDLGRHGRSSLRLKDYDCSRPGAYFVTIPTRNRECLFGEVHAGSVALNAFGAIIRDCWGELPGRYPAVELDAFVVMPSHVHGIIWLREDAATDRGLRAGLEMSARAGAVVEMSVRAIHELPLPGELPLPAEPPLLEFPSRSSPDQEDRLRRRRMLLPLAVGFFKMQAARRINHLRDTTGVPVWHRNYYEHVIRDELSLDRIRRYTEENPLQWTEDEENPANFRERRA